MCRGVSGGLVNRWDVGVGTRYVSLVVVDVEKFGSRPDFIKSVLRKRLYEILLGSFEAVGIDRETSVVGLVDRGDGVAVLVDAAVDKATLTGAFVDRLAEELRRHEAQSARAAWMRWRVSLHAGEVTPDDNGFSGEALNTACRIVDLQLLRDVLNLAGEHRLVVALSDNWYRAVVTSGWAGGSSYREAPVVVKEMRELIHVRTPGLPAPPWPPEPGHSESAAPVAAEPVIITSDGREPADTRSGSGSATGRSVVSLQQSDGGVYIDAREAEIETVTGSKTTTIVVHGDVTGLNA